MHITTVDRHINRSFFTNHSRRWICFSMHLNRSIGGVDICRIINDRCTSIDQVRMRRFNSVCNNRYLQTFLNGT
jgi:hypothetical protein